MNTANIIANCFMGLVGLMAIVGQVGLVTGMIGPV